MYSVFAGPGKKGFFPPFVWMILFLVCATISLPNGGVNHGKRSNGSRPD